LLKILARITSPSEGRVRIHGRAGSLLEVGTGFHPDLTGRENVFLNGSVLGMPRSEISRKFDEIVDFAEVPAFIDTPVKRYSSGMQMRLAFAVAAHLEPEILIVDEVLAVGDAAFQRKCLGRMGTAAAEGRTVLFVSHNLTAVRTLCPRAILLESGRIAFDGSSDAAIDSYLEADEQAGDGADLTISPRSAEGQAGRIRFTALKITGANSGAIRVGDPMSLVAEFDVSAALADVTVKLNLFSVDDTLIAQSVTTNSYTPIATLLPGHYRIAAIIDPNPFQPGRYRIGISASDARRLQDYVPHAATIEVLESPAGLESPWFAGPGGYIRIAAHWAMPLLDNQISPET